MSSTPTIADVRRRLDALTNRLDASDRQIDRIEAAMTELQELADRLGASSEGSFTVEVHVPHGGYEPAGELCRPTDSRLALRAARDALWVHTDADYAQVLEDGVPVALVSRSMVEHRP